MDLFNVRERRDSAFHSLCTSSHVLPPINDELLLFASFSGWPPIFARANIFVAIRRLLEHFLTVFISFGALTVTPLFLGAMFGIGKPGLLVGGIFFAVESTQFKGRCFHFLGLHPAGIQPNALVNCPDLLALFS